MRDVLPEHVEHENAHQADVMRVEHHVRAEDLHEVVAGRTEEGEDEQA